MKQGNSGWTSLLLTGLLAMACASASATTTSTTKHHAPPPMPIEAYEVCQNLAEHDACSMTMPDGDVLDGTCEVAPPAPGSAASSAVSTAASTATTGKLACRPSHMPPPPDGKGPDADGDEDQE